MGHGLIAHIWTIPQQRLPNPTARIVLIRMAQTALDDDDPPTYYAGWDTLALALGYHHFDKAAERVVARAIAQLTEAGLIKPDGHAPGRNRRYRLTL